MIKRNYVTNSLSSFMKIHIKWLILPLVIVACQKDDQNNDDPNNLLARLNSLAGVTAIEVEPQFGYPRAFQIDFRQAVDHHNSGGPTFAQRIYLSHSDENSPMIFGPSGYGSSPSSVQEIAGIMQTNHLAVVHRFFWESEPANMDWQYLTIKQSADDHHRIVEVFKNIYPGVWISSGVSKGGLTCLFHKRFHPDDVDATLAYVAPIEFGTADPRFLDYLANIGTEECREDIHNFQRRCLIERDSLIPRLMNWLAENNYTIAGNPEVVYEDNVSSYDWTFWQYHTYDCSEIPGEESSYDEVISHLIEVTKLYRSTDDMKYYFRPYVYQAFTEIGYPAISYEHISDLLQFDPDDLLAEDLAYYGIPVVYKPETILDINDWLINHGNNIIYIYGSIDPWSGGEIALTGATNAVKIMQEGGDHRIKIMDLDEKELVLNTLESWTGIEINDIQSKNYQIVVEEEERIDLGL